MQVLTLLALNAMQVPGLSTKVIKQAKAGADRPTEQLVQEYEGQIAALLGQVDGLHVELMHQSQQQVLIQVRLSSRGLQNNCKL